MVKRPAVVSGEHVLFRFGAGIGQLANLLRSTYGPAGRAVLSAGPTPGSEPELLTSGGDIARRLVQLADPVEDAGAMFLRGMLCDLHDTQSDGVTLAAIVMHSLFAGGRRAIASGANPERLRYHLLAMLPGVLDTLRAQSRTVGSDTDVRRIARAVTTDEPLTGRLVDLSRRLGVHGHIDVRNGHDRQLQTTIMEGPFWESAVLDGALTGGLIGQRASLPQCAVFVSDLPVAVAEDVGRMIDAARQQEARSLLIVARKLEPAALATIMLNRNETFPIMAVQPPKAPPDQREQELADLAMVTGARLFRAARGDAIASLASGDLGRAREAWVSYTHTGFVSPQGDGLQIRQRLRDLREQWHDAEETAAQRLAGRRIARLSGRSAVLHVGGNTPQTIARKRTEAEQTVRVIAAAHAGGVVPGGGLALLACLRMLNDTAVVAGDLEAQWARSLLAGALAAPVRQLAINAGRNPALAESQEVQPACSPTLDPAGIIEGSLRMAVSAAAQALTIDHVVLHRTPAVATKP